jgi:RecB family exonuclease
MCSGRDYWHGARRKDQKVPWNHVSPSQIENYQKCKRSWFFKSILKTPEGQRGHQSLGEAFHLIMERVPKGLGMPDHADVDASPEDWGKAEDLAKLALPLLPEDPSHSFKREWGIRLETYEGGPTMIGYVDLGIPVGHGWPAFLIPSNEAIVADYKTLSDFRYMRTPQELASSVQMMTYAKWAIEPWPTGLHGENLSQPEHVRLLHMYAKTRAPFTRSSVRFESAIVTPQEINTQWAKTLDTIHDMEHVANSCKTADDVTATGTLTGHCEAYGGCYFRDKCGLSPTSGIKTLFQIGKKSATSIETQETSIMAGSSILDKIKAARAKEEAAKAGTSTPATSTSTVALGAASTTSTASGIRTEVTQTTPIASPVATVDNFSPSGTVDNSATTEKGATEKSTLSAAANTGNPPTESVIAKGPISGLMAKIQAQGKGTPTLGGALAGSYGKEIGSQAAGFAGTDDLGKSTCNTIAELLKLANGVVPPDAPSRTQEVITRPGDQVQDPTKETEDDNDTGDAVGESPVDLPTGAASSTVSGNGGSGNLATSPSPDVGKKRGRPSNAEIEARKAEEAKRFDEAVKLEVAKRLSADFSDFNEAVEAEVAKRLANGPVPLPTHDRLNDLQTQLKQTRLEAEAERQIAEQRKEDNRKLYAQLEQAMLNLADETRRKPSVEGLTLYIDCYPTKGETELTDYYEWIAPICVQVAASNNVGDWREIQYTAKGMFANAIRESIKTGNNLPRAMFVSSSASGSEIAIEVLTPLARRIIRRM